MDTAEDQVIESEEQQLEGQETEEVTEVTEETPEAEETAEDEVESEVEDEEPEEAVEEPKMSRRAEKRIEQLKIKSLIANLKQTNPQGPTIKPGLDYSEKLEAEPEVLQQFEQDRRDYGQQNYQAGLEQAKSIQFHTRLEIDAPKVETKYSVLNPQDKENFNPAAADAINEMYLSAVGYDKETGTVQNPNIRYSDYIEGIMELAGVVASDKTQKSVKNIAKQAAQTGLRPDGSQAKKSLNLNKAPEQMTDEELDAFISGKLK